MKSVASCSDGSQGLEMSGGVEGPRKPIRAVRFGQSGAVPDRGLIVGDVAEVYLRKTRVSVSLNHLAAGQNISRCRD